MVISIELNRGGLANLQSIYEEVSEDLCLVNLYFMKFDVSHEGRTIMQSLDSMVVFEYPGGQISFHKDLKKYYEIQKHFREESPVLLKYIEERTDPEQKLNSLTAELIHFIEREILLPLSEYGCYNLTTEDFLKTNTGYIQMANATSEYYSYVAGEEAVQNAIAEGKKVQARNTADQTIVGTGYNLYSNDLIAHAIYAAQSKREFEKQAFRADMQYYQALNEIEKSSSAAIRDKREKYMRENYIPQMQSCAQSIMNEMALHYCEQLAVVKQFDLACIGEIDEARSNALLNNLRIVNNKEGLIYSAIQLCPYNLDIYKKAYETDVVFTETHRGILDFFGLTYSLRQWVLEGRPTGKASIVVEWPKAKKMICALAALNGTAEDISVARTWFRESYYKRIDLFLRLGRMISSELPLYPFLKEKFKTFEEEEYSDQLRLLMLKEKISDAEEIIYEEIGYSTKSVLSNAFGVEIASFSKAIDYVLKIWENESVQVLERVKKERERIEQERLARQRALEEEESLQRKRDEEKAAIQQAKRKKNKIIISVFCVLAIVGIVVGMIITKVVMPAQKYEQAIALISDGNSEESIPLLMEISGYKDSGERLVQLWDSKAVRDTIATGGWHTVGLKADGTVIATGYNEDGRCNVSEWKDIIAISAGMWHTVGLKADGTVVAVGMNEDGQCNVSEWKNIVAIAAGNNTTVGLKADGTVVAVGKNKDGQCNVSEWKNIVAIAAGDEHTIGLKADGTVVAVGSNNSGSCKVSNWCDIVAIDAGSNFTIGIKKDGTLISAGLNYKFHDISKWRDIVDIDAGEDYVIGLKADGTVLACAEYDFDGKTNVSNWKDIVEVSAAWWHTVGLKSDGTVVATGSTLGAETRLAVYGWKLR